MKTMIAAASVVALAFVLGGAAKDADPEIHILATPGAMSAETGGTVDIVETIHPKSGADWTPSFSLGTKAPGMAHTQKVEALTVSDAQGALAGTLDQNDAEGSFVWTASRPAKGAVVAHYRLPVVNDNPISGGPPTYVRIEGNSLSGVGDMLFLQPKLEGDYRISVDWDLKAMGPGAEAVSTYGDGDFSLPPGNVGRLAESFYIAGKVSRYPGPGKHTFSAVWPGDPGFDPRPSLAWSEKLYGYMSKFFGDKAEPEYRIFMRYNPAANAGGGAAFPHSFLWTYGEGITGFSMQSILGHEMTHTWTAGVSKWFDEGLAVYYQIRLPWRAGMVTSDDYLADINNTAARYYTSELVNMAFPQVMTDYWGDRRKIVIPYDRGAIYLASVDEAIRQKSGGKRSLDDVVRIIVARLRVGQSLSDKDWIDLMRSELGQPGVDGYDAMIAGRTQLPGSSAYGPCFRRVDTMIRRYNLGYTVKQPSDGRGAYYVENLIKGSEADKAGIRNGDAIILRTNTDGAQRIPDMTLTVKITRDGKTFPVTYLPRAEPVSAYKWERDSAVPESRCRP
jgi:predicted metalloprotease with PDZ domain